MLNVSKRTEEVYKDLKVELRKAAKKFFLVAWPLRGRGVRVTKKKESFSSSILVISRLQVLFATKLERGGGGG